MSKHFSTENVFTFKTNFKDLGSMDGDYMEADFYSIGK